MREKINPVGLKGNEINERMKELMGIRPINESKKTSAVELTKVGPDGNVYAIVRENHEYYIKTSAKKSNLVTEDFSYIGGLQNKKSEAYPSYAKAIKQLNLKFNSLNEAYGKSGQINVFEDDNLLNEMGYGFTGEGNLEGNKKSDCCGGQVMEGMCMECGGSAYGTMNEKKYTDDASEFISKEISHLVHDKGYSQERAVAAALNVAREKGYKVPEKADESTHIENEGLSPEMEAVDAMMAEKELSDKQKKIAALAGDPDEFGADDLAALRAGKHMEEEEMTDKEKEFAALAEPKDKITYADKIAGATKKEGRLSIEKAISEMDSIIESVLDSIKKKV
jgi:hypothetical protein